MPHTWCILRSDSSGATASTPPPRRLTSAAQTGEFVGYGAPLGVRELASRFAVADRSQHSLAGARGVEDCADVLVEAGRLLDVGDGRFHAFGGAPFL